MPDGRRPSPTCRETNYVSIDAGTSCLRASETPTPVGSPTPIPNHAPEAVASHRATIAELTTVVYPFPTPSPNPAAGTPESPTDGIEAACKEVYDPMLACNFFVGKVKAKLPAQFSAVELPEGQADAMVKAFEEKWITLKDAEEAMTYASKGAFVIVGLHTSVAALNKVKTTISGTVKISADSKSISIVADNKDLREYKIPPGANVKVKEGDRANAGDVLMLTKPTHGHVAIIVDGTVDEGPKCYSTNEGKKGKYDGKSKGDKPLFGWVFKRDDAKNVKYFTPPEKPPAAKQ